MDEPHVIVRHRTVLDGREVERLTTKHIRDRRRILEKAEKVLTEKQLVAWRLSTNGMSEQRIAIHLRISRRAVRDRLAAADIKIRRALEQEAA